MFNSRDQIGGTQPLSSAESIEAKAPPSELLANSDNTPISMQTSKKPSPPTLPTGKSGSTTLTTPATTPTITEKIRQHAMLAKVTLKILEKAGLIKRFKVLSKDEQGLTTLKEIRIVFDPAIWTEDLELK